MKHLSLFFILWTTWLSGIAQTIIFDRGHFDIVNENGLIRQIAEINHNSYLSTVNNRLSDINLNITSVVLVQTMIHSSLTQVNQALKSGLTLVQISQIADEIIRESSDMIALARGNPALLLFAEDVARQLKSRGVNLVSEVSGFILKEGDNVLMDFEKRDALLRKVVLELKVMRALCFSMSRSMYWARINGVLKTANPYRDFINRDTRLVEEVLFNYQILK